MSMEAISGGAGSAANRHSAALSATSPTDYEKSGGKFQPRKPIGGVAVLPMEEMRRIEEQRRTPTDTAGKSRPFSQSSSSIKSPTSDTSEVSASIVVNILVIRHYACLCFVINILFYFFCFRFLHDLL